MPDTVNVEDKLAEQMGPVLTEIVKNSNGQDVTLHIDSKGGRWLDSEHTIPAGSYAACKVVRWRGEVCWQCGRDQRMAWSVTDECWLRIVPEKWQERTLCLECFFALADEKKEPVSYDDFRHLSVVAFAEVDGGPGPVERPTFLE